MSTFLNSLFSKTELPNKEFTSCHLIIFSLEINNLLSLSFSRNTFYVLIEKKYEKRLSKYFFGHSDNWNTKYREKSTWPYTSVSFNEIH